MSGVAYLGVDVGSTSVKAAVYTSAGRCLGIAAKPSRSIRPHIGWSEQDMDEVWSLTCDAMRSAIEAAGVRIDAIGVSGQGDGLWALDDALRPVRNAILWNDARADDLVLGWIADGTSAKLSRYSRTSNWAGTAGTLLRWLEDNEPENAARIRHILFCKDWINLRLTSVLSTDYSDASIPFLDIETRAYAPEAFDLLGIGRHGGALPALARSIDIKGGLTAEAAVALGLVEGTPVATGTIDLGAQMAGMNLGRPGDVYLVLGTTAMLNIVTMPEPFAGEPVGATLAHSYADRFIRVIAPLTGTQAYDWFLSINPDLAALGDAGAISSGFGRLAASAPAGSHGALFLPYLAGERAPFVAPQATGAFHGLTTANSRADLARAVLEGVAFSLKHCVRSTGLAHPAQVFLTGGGGRNAFWCDILANVLGTTIVASDESDHGLWGSALIAAAAVGHLDVEKPPHRPQRLRRHAPDASTTEVYERLFGLYAATSGLSAPLWDARRTALRHTGACP